MFHDFLFWLAVRQTSFLHVVFVLSFFRANVNLLFQVNFKMTLPELQIDVQVHKNN